MISQNILSTFHIYLVTSLCSVTDNSLSVLKVRKKEKAIWFLLFDKFKFSGPKNGCRPIFKLSLFISNSIRAKPIMPHYEICHSTSISPESNTLRKWAPMRLHVSFFNCWFERSLVLGGQLIKIRTDIV